MADKLKRCPFCGGEVELVKQKSDEFEFMLVSCKNCDATIGIGGADNEQKVTEAWNKRPSPWHTGTPTEEGLYVVFNEHLCYDIVEVKPWTTLHGVVAYQKIEPYKED